MSKYIQTQQNAEPIFDLPGRVQRAKYMEVNRKLFVTSAMQRKKIKTTKTNARCYTQGLVVGRLGGGGGCIRCSGGRRRRRPRLSRRHRHAAGAATQTTQPCDVAQRVNARELGVGRAPRGNWDYSRGEPAGAARRSRPPRARAARARTSEPDRGGRATHSRTLARRAGRGRWWRLRGRGGDLGDSEYRGDHARARARREKRHSCRRGRMRRRRRRRRPMALPRRLRRAVVAAAAASRGAA